MSSCPRGLCRLFSGSGWPADRGSVIAKREPVPGWECTVSLRPRRSQIRLEMERPKPRPFFSVWIPSDKRLNSSKILGKSSRCMPMPVSQTSIRTSGPKVRMANRTCPWGSVYRKALDKKFCSTRRSSFGSVWTMTSRDLALNRISRCSAIN